MNATGRGMELTMYSFQTVKQKNNIIAFKWFFQQTEQLMLEPRKSTLDRSDFIELWWRTFAFVITGRELLELVQNTLAHLFRKLYLAICIIIYLLLESYIIGIEQMLLLILRALNLFHFQVHEVESITIWPQIAIRADLWVIACCLRDLCWKRQIYCL